MKLSHHINFLIFILLFLLPSCSLINEDFPVPADDENFMPTDLYFALNIMMPNENGSRSATTNGGGSGVTQNGKENENKVSSAYIYFYNIDNGSFVTSFFVSQSMVNKSQEKIEGKSDGVYKLTAKVEYEQLKALLGKKLNLYVLANPQGFHTEESDFLKSTFSFTPRPFVTGGILCPMSNLEKYEVNLSAYNDLDLEGASKSQVFEHIKGLFSGDYEKGKLWDVSNGEDEGKYKGKGSLKLERSIARIDYKSSETGNVKDLYRIANAKEEVYVKIVSMQLFNLSQNAYYFRHTAKGGKTKATEPISPFGKEKNEGTSTDENSYTWIADCNWEGTSPTYTKDISLFLNPMKSTTTENEKTNWSIGGDDSNLYCTTMQDFGTTDYKEWYYINENTLPSTTDMTLEKATGIAFRVIVCNANGIPITGQAGGTFRITLGGNAGDKEGHYRELEWTPTNDEEKEPGGFYMTYYYLIEHNNNQYPSSDQSGSSSDNNTVNGKDGKRNNLDPMQIGIVRNNVYQLSVTGINNIPDTKEPDNYSLSIDIKVLPWVKRSISVSW
ncbi:MAG: fimbria major subunit [Muribaculaceae bacterium]|nr:fimbria major subunit [Muribaculaceae bacterium]